MKQSSLVAYDVRAGSTTSVYYNDANMPWAAFNQKFAGDSLLAWVEIANNV
jgi:hypothetical protein